MNIALRALVMATVLVGQLLAWRLVDGEYSGANIGAGLIAFGVAVVMAFAWAAYDARRRPTGTVIRDWAVVALVFAVAISVAPQVFQGGDGMDVDVWLSDLLSLSALSFVMVFGPASMAALVVGAATDARRDG